jgi:hypothetical protein
MPAADRCIQYRIQRLVANVIPCPPPESGGRTQTSTCRHLITAVFPTLQDLQQCALGDPRVLQSVHTLTTLLMLSITVWHAVS